MKDAFLLSNAASLRDWPDLFQHSPRTTGTFRVNEWTWAVQGRSRWRVMGEAFVLHWTYMDLGDCDDNDAANVPPLTAKLARDDVHKLYTSRSRSLSHSLGAVTLSAAALVLLFFAQLPSAAVSGGPPLVRNDGVLFSQETGDCRARSSFYIFFLLWGSRVPEPRAIVVGCGVSGPRLCGDITTAAGSPSPSTPTSATLWRTPPSSPSPPHTDALGSHMRARVAIPLHCTSSAPPWPQSTAAPVCETVRVNPVPLEALAIILFSSPSRPPPHIPAPLGARPQH